MHRIRLGSAWRLRVTPAGRATKAPLGIHMEFPVKLPLRSEPLENVPPTAAIELRRAFHQPSKLADGQRVRLVLTGNQCVGRITLNDVALERKKSIAGETDDSIAFEIRDLLQPRNELAIEVVLASARSANSTLLQSAVLEIE